MRVEVANDYGVLVSVDGKEERSAVRERLESLSIPVFREGLEGFLIPPSSVARLNVHKLQSDLHQLGYNSEIRYGEGVELLVPLASRIDKEANNIQTTLGLNSVRIDGDGATIHASAIAAKYAETFAGYLESQILGNVTDGPATSNSKIPPQSQLGKE
jgi:hypothetical protein